MVLIVSETSSHDERALLVLCLQIVKYIFALRGPIGDEVALFIKAISVCVKVAGGPQQEQILIG